MTLKRQRLLFLLGGLCFLGLAAFITLTAFRDNLVFFYSPTDYAKLQADGKMLRIGGLVQEVTHAGKDVSFRVTDMKHDIIVHYQGVLPDLFREGQGVVAEGTRQPDGSFKAERVFAKHDENYMPPEVADALKKSGHWKEKYKK